jgi:hypothetical protein
MDSTSTWTSAASENIAFPSWEKEKSTAFIRIGFPHGKKKKFNSLRIRIGFPYRKKGRSTDKNRFSSKEKDKRTAAQNSIIYEKMCSFKNSRNKQKSTALKNSFSL